MVKETFIISLPAWCS